MGSGTYEYEYIAESVAEKRGRYTGLTKRTDTKHTVCLSVAMIGLLCLQKPGGARCWRTERSSRPSRSEVDDDQRCMTRRHYAVHRQDFQYTSLELFLGASGLTGKIKSTRVWVLDGLSTGSSFTSRQNTDPARIKIGAGEIGPLQELEKIAWTRTFTTTGQVRDKCCPSRESSFLPPQNTSSTRARTSWYFLETRLIKCCSKYVL